MKTFFIADTHFGEDTLLRYENRPFADPAAMDAALIDRWNAVVGEEDEVWVLGDFGAAGREAEILTQLKGKKYLVKGNHDTESNDYYRRAGFAEVYDRPVLYRDFFILSHAPLYVSENMPYANLFGHVHASPVYRDFSAHHFCVCVERTEYTPLTLEEILSKIQ